MSDRLAIQERESRINTGSFQRRQEGIASIKEGDVVNLL